MGLKVLVCHPGPQYSVADVHSKIVKGLRDNGCEVGDLNLDRYLDFFCASHVDRGNGLERFVSYEDACRMACDYAIDHACYTFWPDVVIIVSGFFVPPEKYRLLRAHGHHLVLWCTESPYEDDRQLAMAQFADTVILNDPQNINEFKQKNRRTFYIPHSYDPDIHHPGPFSQEHASDFFFVGTGYPSRMEFFENVDWDGIDVALAGNWKEAAGTPLEQYLTDKPGDCIDNTDVQPFYWSTKASANIYRKEAQTDDLSEGWAVGPREIELAATKTFFLREARGESDLLFPMLPTFSCPGDFGEKLRWWLAHDRERADAAEAAAAAVTDRTVTETAATLLRHINP